MDKPEERERMSNGKRSLVMQIVIVVFKLTLALLSTYALFIYLAVPLFKYLTMPKSPVIVRGGSIYGQITKSSQFTNLSKALYSVQSVNPTKRNDTRYLYPYGLKDLQNNSAPSVIDGGSGWLIEVRDKAAPVGNSQAIAVCPNGECNTSAVPDKLGRVLFVLRRTSSSEWVPNVDKTKINFHDLRGSCSPATPQNETTCNMPDTFTITIGRTGPVIYKCAAFGYPACGVGIGSW